MADVTFGHRTGHTPPATMDRPDHWRYVATRLLAHIGAYSPDEMNGLHWRWHQCAALRIRAAMQDHNIWNIPGSPGNQGHASGHRRQRSQDVPEPPRQAARRTSPEQPRGPPPGRGSPSGTYSSPHGGARAVPTPRGCKETRRSSAKKRGTLTDPVAAAARLSPQRDESSSMRIWTGTTGAPATPKLGEHPRPPTRDASPRGPAPSRRTSPPFSRRLSASGKQRFKRTLARRRAKRPANLPPPSRGQRPIRYREDHTPRTLDQESPRPTPTLRKGRGGSPPRSPEAARPPQPGHDASGPRADTEMTGTSSPQEPAGPLPTATPCSMPRQREPPTEYLPGGQPGATSGQPSPADAALDQERVAMPPPPPRPPQQQGTDPFDYAELKKLYDIHASTPSSELVATLRKHLRNVDPNRLFAVVPLPHAPTTQIFVRQLQPLVTSGHRSLTTSLKLGSGGSTPTNRPKGVCGSHTWAGYTRS